MSKLARRITLGVLALGIGTTALAAQQKPRGPANYRWYIGGQGGVMNFETTGQTRGWLPSGGGHFLIIAKRTGLLISVDEGLGGNEVGVYEEIQPIDDTTFIVFPRTAQFQDIRRYSFVLMAFPWRSPIEPYFGVGGGIMHAVSPQPVSTTFPVNDASFEQANDASSTGFLTALAGLQLRGGPFVIFGQAQISSSASRGSIFVGPTYSGQAGLRISLGSSRDD